MRLPWRSQLGREAHESHYNALHQGNSRCATKVPEESASREVDNLPLTPESPENAQGLQTLYCLRQACNLVFSGVTQLRHLELFCSHLQESHARQRQPLELQRNHSSNGNSAHLSRQKASTYFNCSWILKNGNSFMSPDAMAWMPIYSRFMGLEQRVNPALPSCPSVAQCTPTYSPYILGS